FSLPFYEPAYLLASCPTTPPIAAPPKVPAVLPPVSTAPPTAPAPAPMAVLRPCRDMPLQAVRLASRTTVTAPAAIRLPVFRYRSLLTEVCSDQGPAPQTVRRFHSVQ